MGTPPLLAHELGRRLASFRRDRGGLQEEVAVEARHRGLSWTRARVAAFETARIDHLEEAEFLLVADVYGAACGEPTTAEDLLGSDEVGLTPLRTVKGNELRRLLTTDLHVGIAVGDTAAGDDAIGWIRRRLPNEDPATILNDGERDAERRAATKLGGRLGVDVPSYMVAVAARRQWDRAFTDERNSRVRARLPEGAPAETVRAVRGRISRELLHELEPVVRRITRPRSGIRE